MGSADSCLGSPISKTSHQRPFLFQPWSRLHNDCPIPWPSSSGTHKDQDSAGSCSSTSNEDTVATWLSQRYFQCLWLGESYFPLVDFVLIFDAALRGDQGSTTERATEAFTTIAPLLLSISSIQNKYREVLPHKLKDAQEDVSSKCISSAEWRIIQASLQSGPGKLVSEENKQVAEQDTKLSSKPYKLRNQWLNAMERRELSLQVLLVLEVLRLSVEFPGIFKSEDVKERLEIISTHRRTAGTESKVVFKAEDVSDFLSQSRALLESQSQGVALPESQMESQSQGDALPESQMLDSQDPSQLAKDSQVPSDSQSQADLPLSQTIDDADSSSQALPSGSVSLAEATTSKKKRKRKSMPARRWTGFSMNMDGDDNGEFVGFPWEKRPSRPGETGNSDVLQNAGNEEEHNDLFIVCDAEKLQKRFESLIDCLSLRIITADLSHDLLDDVLQSDDRKTGDVTGSPNTKSSSSDDKKGKKAPSVSFGTSARSRGDDDESDELYFLYSAIVDTRYSKDLPRQCSNLRSRAITGATGNTPARPKAAKTSSSAGITGGNSNTTQRQRQREEQQLIKTRKEADLIVKGESAKHKAKVREERRASQRPALRDALFQEEKQQRKDRSSSIVADAERNKREVSVKRRVGWSRSASTSQAEHSERYPENVARESQTQQSQSSANGNGNIPAMPFGAHRAFNKRKSMEPQRFGGLFPNAFRRPAMDAGQRTTSQKSNLNGLHSSSRLASPNPASAVDENPFLDSSSKQRPFSRVPSMSTADSQQPGRIVVAETPRKTKRIRPQLVPVTQSSDPLFSGRSSSPWVRTESQPVSSKDLAQLKDPFRPRSSTPVHNPFHPPASNATARNSRLSVPQQHDTSSDRSVSLARSRGSSRATSIALSEMDADAGVDMENVSCSSLTSVSDLSDQEEDINQSNDDNKRPVTTKKLAADEEEEEEEEEEMLFFQPRSTQPSLTESDSQQPIRKPLQGLSGINNWLKTSSINDGNSVPGDSGSGGKPAMARRPSGRNPFAKSRSMQVGEF
ncbi:unnamed protein product [Sympodiomycopsis kandeliae]